MIAIDAMGGDNAPRPIIEGALRAAREGVALALCGPELIVRAELSALCADWEMLPIKVFHADDVIEMGDEPVAAFKKKSRSSMHMTVSLVAQGIARHAMSAGNSGALVVCALFLLGRQPGIERPAIAGFLATPVRPVLVLDLGANTDIRPHHLVQFARLGTDYLVQTRSMRHPTVGLLANGHEEGKGSLIGKEAFELLRGEKSINFQGNVEPRSLFHAEVDIVVTDGFTGNIVLKTMESVYEASLSMIEREHRLPEEVAQSFRQATDPQHRGGALLLGVKGSVFVCHGSANATAIYHAIMKAVQQ